MKKVVLITGASSGIGHATAKRYLDEGHKVYCAARRTELMENLKKIGGHIINMDVRDDQSVKKGIQKVINDENRIDILVNNAGFAAYGSVEDLPIEKAKDQFETNVFGYARTIKEVLPQMKNQKLGTIINVTSTAGKVAPPIVAWYAASKFALEGLLDALRNEVSQFGIKVVMIEPGFIDTGLYDVAWKLLDKVEVSEGYEKMTKAFKEDFLKRQKNAPGPKIIADAIYKAGLSSKPKPRYALPGDAKTYIFLRKILSDRMFDRVIRKMLGIK